MKASIETPQDQQTVVLRILTTTAKSWDLTYLGTSTPMHLRRIEGYKARGDGGLRQGMRRACAFTPRGRAAGFL